MIIGVDAGAISVTDDRLKVGVWRVTLEALKELVQLDRENEYRLYSFGEGIGGIGEIRGIGGERIKEIRLPSRGWSSVWLPLELRRRPVDIFLGLSQALPFSKKSYNIGFIYDLGFLFHREAYGRTAAPLEKQTHELIRRADRIITISDTTKADIVLHYGVPPDRITAVYPGVDSRFSPAGKLITAPRPYVLFVGSLNKAKDIPTLIEAVGHTECDLYLIGGDFWPDPAIDETISRLLLKHRIKRLGCIPDEELPTYYRAAVAFVTTALREGFCLPAAEAMACGTPVVALDRGALKEIVGVGGIVANDTKDFIDAINTITDRNVRKRYATQAIRQSRKFRWEEFARAIFHAYQTD